MHLLSRSVSVAQVLACARWEFGNTYPHLRCLPQALALYPAKLAAGPAFPTWYPEVFRNRWRFATSRLALQATPPDFDFVSGMSATSAIDHAVLSAQDYEQRKALTDRHARLALAETAALSPD
jgi:hypothetical protein